MIYPSIDEMLKKVDSRYSLVIMAAKRARSLRERQILKEDAGSIKEVSAALEDVAKGRITFQRIKDGIK
ncbi:MAG: DNA-directed RNA polymerase subunit omega [Firmicutes bacterium]|nr:DNA-directed RNA polymerase subunit omega [Bacillota bacterium]